MWRSRWNNRASALASTQLFESSAINAPVGARNLGNLKELRTRIAAIKSIKKITSTMKLVAASKLSKAQQKLEKTKPYTHSALRFFEAEFPVPALLEDGKEAELNEYQIETLQKMPGKHLIVTITSDRGLCGGVNSSIVRAAKKLASINPPKTELILLGDKSTAGLTKEFVDNFVFTVSEISGNVATSYTEIAQIADGIIKQDFERITVLHNSFLSVLAFATRRRVFPSKESFKDRKRFPQYEFEDSREEDLDDYYAFSFGNFLYGAIFEAHATELGARMTSMDNATTNASDVLNKLSIKYNKQRQAVITTELTEIVSGAAAIEAMESKD